MNLNDPPGMGQQDGAQPADDTEEFAGGLTAASALALAEEALSTSTDYMDANFRKEWETALRYFDGRHASDSRYYNDRYKHRSKGFRPKSRSLVRKLEAQTSAAFFSNPTIVDVTALDEGDPAAAATAKMINALVQYRLEHSIPTFKIVCGGMQDAAKTGVVASYNHWVYKTVKRMKRQPVIDPETGLPVVDMTGQPLMQDVQVDEVVEDKPAITLIPVENVRISPNARWDDPINSSPYVGRIVPMYISEVREKIEKADRNGRTWIEHTDAEILAAHKSEFDTTKQARLGNRQDPENTTDEPKQYSIVNAIEWIFARPEGDVCFWTIGTTLLMTEPYPLEEAYLHGVRPITMGYVNMETHKTMPKGMIAIGAPLQRELNDITNDRRDNVRLVLNKQWFVASGKQIDTSNMMYGVPGGVTHVPNPKEDVVAQEWNDVTSSAYQEQDRLNGDYDELTGNFSASSIVANRRLNETVGGLELLGEGANALSEYTIKTFSETWFLPTVRQLGLLEQYYETDETILAICGAKAAQEALKVGQDEMLDRLIRTKCVYRMRVGMNATDPNRKLLRFVLAMRNVAEMSSRPMPGVNMEEVGAEVFSLLGYGDGKRFFDGSKNDQMVIQAATQQAEQILGQAELAAKAMLEAAERRLEDAEKAEQKAEDEQLKLIKQENALMERIIAAALKEIKVQKDAEMAALAARQATQSRAAA